MTNFKLFIQDPLASEDHNNTAIEVVSIEEAIEEINDLQAMRLPTPVNSYTLLNEEGEDVTYLIDEYED